MYIDKIDKRIINYFKILEPEFPVWLNEYIETPALLKQQYISVTCGMIYTKLFKNNFFYSSLDHSIGVALIVWHFTHDKKQTLAGLFHDIATPAFKHCIDFLNGDYEKQESTEDLTSKIIENSVEIMSLLKRDNIKLEEVCDYHIYPIADNNTPQLSADRLEYSLSNAIFTYLHKDIKLIKRIYNDISIQKNEHGEIELGFNTIEIASKFVEITTKLSIIYRENRTRFSMQFLADIVKKLINDSVLSIEDLYKLSDNDVINIIEKSRYRHIFKKWKNSYFVTISKKKPRNIYNVNIKAKIRYIDPLVSKTRISKIDEEANLNIINNLKYDMSNFIYMSNINKF